MLFNSFDFMLFFPIVIIIYFVIPKKSRYIWLFLASYYFYMSWNPKYALLMGTSTVITYLSGRLLEKATNINNRKWIVAGSFITNMGILIFFKYFDFILGNINWALSTVGITAVNKPFDVILPVGISFYTFQALGYTMDVYRKDMPAEKSIIRYALFVSFFPQLVAGPIERSKNLLTQINNVEKINVWNYENITRGLMLMIWGLFQKMVIADRVAILVDTVYDSYWMYGSIELVLATFLFAIQIYCDFASYSTIAIGAAKVMGFTLMENFNTPYFATSIQDFWRRWHISLSTWFKDYLYFPLGGSRCSKLKKYRNVMITFLVSGIWHGASWSFIAWGGIHGTYQIIGDFLKPYKERLINRFHVKKDSFSYKFGQILITFVLVDFTWIFFRMNSLRYSLEFIKQIFQRWNPWTLFDYSLYNLGLNQRETGVMIFSLIVLFLVDLIRYLRGKTIEDFLAGQCLWFRWSVLLFLIFFIVIFGIYGPSFDAKQFIYFQF